MIDAFIFQGCLSRHVELSKNMMDKNKAMLNEFKLHLKEYSNFLGPGSSQLYLNIKIEGISCENAKE